MALKVPDAAERVMLEAIVNKTAPQDSRLKLYTSNTTPAEGDTEATYTEASGNGYADKALAGSSWGAASTGGGTSSIAFAEQTFTLTGALGNVYGYFIVQETSGKILWAERFSNGPYDIQNNGDQIKVTPKIELE